MPQLSLSSVNKRYGDVTALDDVSVDFPNAALTAIVGRSGCGKSSLLKLCNGLLQPDSGCVYALGEDLAQADLTKVRRRIGYAVQGSGLFPHLTARANIILMAELEQWPAEDIQDRVSTLTTLAHVDPELLERYPHQLSGGQQQRIGLCRAMMLKPDILLLDEPFAANDPITRTDVQHQLSVMLDAEPTTAVLVTHDSREALSLAQHLVVMDAGRIVKQRSRTQIEAQFPGQAPEAVLAQLLDAGSE